jgi:hypothetical protein
MERKRRRSSAQRDLQQMQSATSGPWVRRKTPWRVLPLHRVFGKTASEHGADIGLESVKQGHEEALLFVDMQADHRFSHEKESLQIPSPMLASGISGRVIDFVEQPHDRLMVEHHCLARPICGSRPVERRVEHLLLDAHVRSEVVVEEAQRGIEAVAQRQGHFMLRVVSDAAHVIEVLTNEPVLAPDELLDGIFLRRLARCTHCRGHALALGCVTRPREVRVKCISPMRAERRPLGSERGVSIGGSRCQGSARGTHPDLAG